MSRARDLAAFVSNADGDIKFDTDTLFIDSSTNRVGIGTTTPASVLHVKGRTLAVDGAAASDSPRLNLDLDGTNKAGVRVNRVSEDLEIDVVGSNNITFDTNSAERMRIDADGRLGLGGTTPNTNMHAATFPATIAAGDQGVIFGNADSLQIGANYYWNGSGFKYLGSGKASRNYHSAGNVVFDIADATGSANGALTFAERVRITNDGMTFNGDTAAANALSDYETGSYNVTAYLSGGGSVSFSGGGNSAFYTKIGRLVTVGARLDVSSTSSPSGHLYLGLPFAGDFTNDSAGLNIAAAAIYNPSSNLSGHLVAEVTDSYSTSLIIRHNGGIASGVTTLGGYIDSGSLISFTISYVAA